MNALNDDENKALDPIELQERVEKAKAQIDAGAQPTLEGIGPAETAETIARRNNGPKPGPRIALVLRKFRVMMDLKPRELAEQIGITTRELTAFEEGKECGSHVLGKVIGWMLGDA